MTTNDDEYEIVFRRFRKGKNGELLDARKYGKRAWPIKIKKTDTK